MITKIYDNNNGVEISIVLTLILLVAKLANTK